LSVMHREYRHGIEMAVLCIAAEGGGWYTRVRVAAGEYAVRVARVRHACRDSTKRSFYMGAAQERGREEGSA
ncbi:MAG TPA: hypothetical protein VIG44_07440, partial [Thermomicrobiales bacterium]